MTEPSGIPAPTLPPPASAPIAPANQPLTSPSLPDLGTVAPENTAVGNRRSKKTGPLIVLAIVTAVVFGIGALAGALLGDSSGGQDVDQPVEPPRTIAPDATSPLLVPINDARDVVDQINDNSVEAELLEEMGFDPTGNAPPDD